MNEVKEEYLALRKLRSALCLDQIAFYAPDTTAMDVICDGMGLPRVEDDSWTVDWVAGQCSVFGGEEELSQARLCFNYDLGIEVEILTYTQGDNWHRRRANEGNGPSIIPGFPFLSHIGFHVNDEPLPDLQFPVAQRMITTYHSNPAIRDRQYEYVIYDTRPVIGVDLKYIKRIA